MKEKMDETLTVRVAATIPKTLHSRDSADRLVRSVISLWRERSDGLRKGAATLILDFEGIEFLSESAAGALVEFRQEFSEEKDPKIEFSNLSASAGKAFAAAEKRIRIASKRTKTQKKKQSSFLIEV
jgi:anti-anti-sigma regulatory factor